MKALILFLLFTIPLGAQTIPYDKKAHFVAGATVATVTYGVVNSETKNENTAFWLGLATGTMAGIAKELYDKNRGYRFDWADFTATLFGAFTMVFIFRIF